MRLKKKDFPLTRIREHLETGPVVLVTSRYTGRSNIMTMGWHSMMEFEPALFGCYIWNGNRSFEAIRKSRECVINIPTAELLDQVVAIGNNHAEDGDKFTATGLTAGKALRVKAPLIDECYASFECRLYDDRMVKKYSFFIWEIVKAHVAKVDKPRTLHYRGRGTFMRAGPEIDRKKRFKPENL
jgi:flavin reductase (DIM6/NTAB) family NADH-FMN oxidoreductase RutF